MGIQSKKLCHSLKDIWLIVSMTDTFRYTMGLACTSLHLSNLRARKSLVLCSERPFGRCREISREVGKERREHGPGTDCCHDGMCRRVKLVLSTESACRFVPIR